MGWKTVARQLSEAVSLGLVIEEQQPHRKNVTKKVYSLTTTGGDLVHNVDLHLGRTLW
jgi:DNA-binding HxlR family transcriptional regulator